MEKLISKIGIFIQDVSSGLYLVEKYKPVTVLLMDAKAEQIQWVRDISPSTKVIFWKHEGDRDWKTEDPEQWAEAIWEQVKECPPDYTYYWNEPLWHGAFGDFPDFDDRQSRFIRRMRQLSSGQVKVGAFCFAEGNFTLEGPDIPSNFPKSMDEAEIVFIHEYWKPRLSSPGMKGYHCQRWEYWLEQFDRVGRGDLPIAVTEFGLTMAVGDGLDVGWMSEEAKLAGVTDQAYLDDISQYHAYCCQETRVPFILPFLCKPWPGQWGTFDLTFRSEIIDEVMAMRVPKPEPTPEEEEMIKVYDFTHGLGSPTYHDLAWLRSYFGNVVVHQPKELRSGDPYWRIVWLDCTVGPTACIIHTDDENGNPLENILTVFYWPTAESLEDQGLALLPHGWTDRGAVGPTNVNGDCGPSYGPGAYYDPAQGEEGPHSVWIYDPDRPAQHITCLGMLTAHPDVEGNHLKFNIGYQLTVYGGEEPTPEPPPEGIPPYEGSILDGLYELEALVRSLGRVNMDELLQLIIELKSKLAG